MMDRKYIHNPRRWTSPGCVLCWRAINDARGPGGVMSRKGSSKSGACEIGTIVNPIFFLGPSVEIVVDGLPLELISFTSPQAWTLQLPLQYTTISNIICRSGTSKIQAWDNKSAPAGAHNRPSQKQARFENEDRIGLTMLTITSHRRRFRKQPFLDSPRPS